MTTWIVSLFRPIDGPTPTLDSIQGMILTWIRYHRYQVTILSNHYKIASEFRREDRGTVEASDITQLIISSYFDRISL